ncbi:glutamate racemase [Pseudoalteromonas sp. DL2-H2.2]|uniref:glutamate racemase n=1 Tax=Pseudoalteromonas sp. DL2-H2.2 TaxID=2908889 RepID=UPI001F3B8493|nr:glutamate racemase [Pseudoalteromonas sp. DL2-H2.2]MCF2911105.1 glutamate racemase [Pseudoalteromonas sp. DL2-H2.2]
MPHILVFDSGIGGTSVLTHIRNALPHADYSYVMDNQLLPYGLQSQQTIQQRLAALIKWIDREQHPVDMIVIACNTASTYALGATRQLTSIPIVGVVPAIKPAALASRAKHIGLLATPATSRNIYTQQLIQQFANECRVDLYQSTKLVELAEQFYWSGDIDHNQLVAEINQLKLSPELDHLVLGCTHFPIIARPLSESIPESVTLIDSGTAIARRVCTLLAQDSAVKEDKGQAHCLAIKHGTMNWYATAQQVHTVERPEIKLINLDHE